MITVLTAGNLMSQCQWYTVTLEDTDLAYEVSWELIDANGVTWLFGGAPFEEDICLPDGCYTLLMFDTGGNGWEDEDWVIEDWIGDFDWDTNLDDGFHGFDVLDLGDNGCSPATGGGNTCPTGTDPYILQISAGADPDEISWFLTVDGSQVAGGGAPYNDTLCLNEGCYFLYMFDDGADSWEGANYIFSDDGGNTLIAGTMTELVTDTVLLNIGGLDCSMADPGGTTGNGCGQQQPSSDCSTAPCICDPYTFQISPSGSGVVYEIPSPGSVSNPSYGPASPSPWGGSDFGCLLAGELNSNWMMFTIANDGVLEFTIGAGGQQVGFYDWEMWAYNGVSTCTNIANNSLSPVRCVWNAVSFGGTGISNVIPAGGNAGNYGPGLAVTAGQQFIICLSNWSYVNASVTIDFTGTADIECSLLLPLEMLDFTANQHEQHADLYWHTANEIDVVDFVVQHSLDGVFWETIGHLSPDFNGNSSHAYTFEHSHPALGENYYRLKEVDLNGGFIFSEKRVVDFKLDSGFEIYPNPANSQIQLVVSEANLNRDLEVFDARGRLVSRFAVSSVQQSIDVANWSEGVYLFRLANSERQSVRLLIEH